MSRSITVDMQEVQELLLKSGRTKDNLQFVPTTLYPNDKPPVHFNGYVIHSEKHDCREHEVRRFGRSPYRIKTKTLGMYLTDLEALVMVYEEKFIEEDDPDDVCRYLRCRKFATLDDVWSFFEKQDSWFVSFLGTCAEYCGDPTMFWLKH